MATQHGHAATRKRKTARKKAREAHKARKKAVKDRREGHRGHIRTVNAPHTW